jgi:hypothetical protein
MYNEQATVEFVRPAVDIHHDKLDVRLKPRLGALHAPQLHQRCAECSEPHVLMVVQQPAIVDADEKPSRKYAELLQEIRIAQGGSQVMIAYLMSLAFTNRFYMLNRLERCFYLGSLILSVCAMALLVAPAVFRHLTFKHRSESQIAVAAGRCVQSGLALLMLSVIATLMFALYAVFQLSLAVSVTAGTFMWFAIWWYLLPLWIRTKRAMASQGRHR